MAKTAGAALLLLALLSPAGVRAGEVEIDPAGKIRPALLEAALTAHRRHRSTLRRERSLIVVDYARHSREPRLYLVDLKTGVVRSHHVAHGRGSDKDHDGRLERYSKVSGSSSSSRGAYRGAERYRGIHGTSLRLDGLETDNANARARAIVLHSEPRYVSEAFLKQYGKLGRSNGCFVVFSEVLEEVMRALEEGALLYVDGLAEGG